MLLVSLTSLGRLKAAGEKSVVLEAITALMEAGVRLTQVSTEIESPEGKVSN